MVLLFLEGRFFISFLGGGVKMEALASVFTAGVPFLIDAFLTVDWV